MMHRAIHGCQPTLVVKAYRSALASACDPPHPQGAQRCMQGHTPTCTAGGRGRSAGAQAAPHQGSSGG